MSFDFLFPIFKQFEYRILGVFFWKNSWPFFYTDVSQDYPFVMLQNIFKVGIVILYM